MHVTRLDIRNLRRIEDVTLRPAPGLNLLLGENGAGKTSLLEGLHLLAYGRSFRGRVRDGLIRTGAPALEVYAEWSEEQSGEGDLRQRRVGLHHGGDAWEGRLDGQNIDQIGTLCAALAAVTFEPGSHGLVAPGGGEARRHYMDWGLFHVEPGFLAVWRRYARALKQRNVLLKRQAPDPELEPWERELAESGEIVTAQRRGYLDALERLLDPLSRQLVPSLGRATLTFHPGWRDEQLSLRDALLVARERDRILGHTTAGPHRADWTLHHARHAAGEARSRGQAKLAALTAIFGQAEHHASQTGRWPVVLLDDLASELDHGHRTRVLGRLREAGVQVFLTGTEPPVAEGMRDVVVFHVEHGRVEPASHAD